MNEQWQFQLRVTLAPDAAKIARQSTSDDALAPLPEILRVLRSGGLMAARARQLGSATPIFDTLLSLCASIDDPIATARRTTSRSRSR